jgi:hypothetical protein
MKPNPDHALLDLLDRVRNPLEPDVSSVGVIERDARIRIAVPGLTDTADVDDVAAA